jgi:hypothetical protein
MISTIVLLTRLRKTPQGQMQMRILLVYNETLTFGKKLTTLEVGELYNSISTSVVHKFLK